METSQAIGLIWLAFWGGAMVGLAFAIALVPWPNKGDRNDVMGD